MPAETVDAIVLGGRICRRLGRARAPGARPAGRARRPPWQRGGRDELRQRRDRPDRSRHALRVSARAERDRGAAPSISIRAPTSAMPRCPRSRPPSSAISPPRRQAGKNATAKAIGAVSRPRQPPSISSLRGRRGPRRSCVAAAGSRRSGARARVEYGEQGGRGAQALWHQPPVMLDRAALAALEPHLSDAAIGGTHRRPVVDSRPRGAGAKLCGALYEARRPDRNGRCAHAGSGGLQHGWSRPPPAGSPPATS